MPMNIETASSVELILTSAVNGVVQGIVLVLLVRWGLRLVPGINSATRYGILFITLLVVAALFPAQLLRMFPLSEPLPAETVSNTISEVAALSAESEPERSNLTVEFPLEVQSEGESQFPVDGSDEMTAVDKSAELAQLPLTRQQPAGEPTVTSRSAGLVAPVWHTPLPRVLGIALVIVWAAAFGLRLGVLAHGLNAIRLLKKRSLPAEPELTELFNQLRDRLAVSRHVQLRVIESRDSAVVLGFIRPVILLPLPHGSPIEDEMAESVLSHELAHVRRYDDWSNLLQQVIQAALFFHPAVWWLKRELALQREIACDDVVLQEARPQTYARILVDLTSRQKGRQLMLAPAVSMGKPQLEQRITMILNPNRNKTPRLARAKLGTITAATVLAALLLLYAGPKLVIAQSADAGQGLAPRPVGPGAQPKITGQPSVSVELNFAQDEEDVNRPGRVPGTPPPPAIRAEEAEEFNEDDMPARPIPRANPRPPRAPRAMVAPRQPNPGAFAAPGGRLEERLDRLERMVQALLAQRNPGHPHVELPPDHDEFGDLHHMKRKIEIEARAAETQRRMAKQAEKMAKSREKMKERGATHEGFEEHIQGLREQREILERQLRELDREIEQVQQEHGRMRDQLKNRGGDEP